jgi:hypothetical protein
MKNDTVMRRLQMLLLLAMLHGSTELLHGSTERLPAAISWPLVPFPALQRKLSVMLAKSGALSCFGLQPASRLGNAEGAHGVPPFMEPEDHESREHRLQCSRIALAVLAQIADDREAMDSWDLRHDDSLFEIRGVDTGGIRIPDILTHDDVVLMLKQLYNNRQCLHPSAIDRLLVQVAALLHEEPNLVHIPSGQRVTVVGDVHGSLADIHRIFQLAGWPGPGNTFIFNGDFVDRGDRGVEVIAMLFALKIVHPQHIFLNRGNHEDFKICRVYGFWEEVMSKYGNRALYTRICDVFALLPLGCIIGQEVLVVHAGLPRSLSVSLSDIDAIPRKLLRSTVRAAWDGAGPLGTQFTRFTSTKVQIY